MLKRALALILALCMVFALTACKSKDKEEETTVQSNEEVLTEVVTNEEGETVNVPVEDESKDETTVEDAQQAENTDKNESKPAVSNNKAPANTNKTAAQKGLNSTNPAEVAAFYVKARNASMSNAPKGNQVMKLSGKIEGEGGIGKLLEIGQGIIDKALANNSVPTDFIPAGGYSDLRASDITSCSAKVQGNYTVVTVHLKDQTDGPNGNKTNGGAVSRGIGTLGSIDEALKELGGAQITEGRDKLTLTYTDAHFTVKIDNNSGRIVSGTWHYLVKINISEAKIKLGLSLPVKGLRAGVDYTVTI